MPPAVPAPGNNVPPPALVQPVAQQGMPVAQPAAPAPIVMQAQIPRLETEYQIALPRECTLIILILYYCGILCPIVQFEELSICVPLLGIEKFEPVG